MNKILIIDDDSSQFFSNMLEADFSIQTSNDTLKALNIFNANSFDAVIVNAHMPNINGFDFITSIKTQTSDLRSALFILNSDNSATTKMRALSLGVRDFLSPEMAKEEIVLRIKNQLPKRSHASSYLIKSYKNLKIDLGNLTVFHDSKKLDLTLIEFKLLSFLITHQTNIVTREELREFVWPKMVVQDKTLNTHLTNLRAKMEGAPFEIKSVKGAGIVLV